MLRTRSVPSSSRQAMPGGSVTAAVPGFQKRKCPSGSKRSDSSSTSMPAKPTPGSRVSRRRADIARAFGGNGKDEVAEHVAAFGRDRVGLAHLDDEVRGAELPAFGEARR